MSDIIGQEIIEVKEKEIEAQGHGDIIAIKQDSAQDIFWLAENIDKLIEAQKKIFMGILKITMPGDFVAFGTGVKETVELRGAACERIARDLGVSFINWAEPKYEEFNDEKGTYYSYTYECDAIFRSRVIRVMGVVSSRSKFHGKEGGKFKEIWEVDRDNVRKAARREAMKEGV